VFGEARRIGARARAQSFLARAVSMSTGLHLDLGDLDAAEELAGEARELARVAAWIPGEVSGGIDLAICRLRRGDVATAARVIEEVAAIVADLQGRRPGSSGFHDWLWAMRLAWARAEIAAARGDRDTVERWAAETLARAAGCRPKYEVDALVTRARTRTGPEARADLDRAIALARPLADPALFVRAARPRLAVDGTDELAAETRAAEARLAGALEP
jgi:hypothetical protein